MSIQNVKRALGDDDESRSDGDLKKIKVVHEPSTSARPVGIEDLCDDVVMHVFQYLHNDDLVNMSRVCASLWRVSSDWTLWKKVKFTKYRKSMEDIYFKYLRDCTSTISVRGDDHPNRDSSISHKFMIQLETKCPDLTELKLYNQKIDAAEVNIKMLHRKLKSFKIKNSIIENIPENMSYLCGINNTCPDLEKVKITYNDWFMPHCLYALAKLEKLTHLSLKGCEHFRECIPYASITAITGFKLLQTLDLRFTPISDHELVCFQRLKTLKHILLESPAGTDHDSDRTISDVGLTGFCQNVLEFQLPYIQIMIDRNGGVNLRRVGDPLMVPGIVADGNDRAKKCNIVKFYIRHYPKVTDEFLKCATKTCPFIEHLDITGTSCTLEEIERCKVERPNIEIVC